MPANKRPGEARELFKVSAFIVATKGLFGLTVIFKGKHPSISVTSAAMSP